MGRTLHKMKMIIVSGAVDMLGARFNLTVLSVFTRPPDTTPGGYTIPCTCVK